MRYSGMAERSLEIAKAYLQERHAFDGTLSEKQALRQRFDALKAAQKPAGAPDSGIERILDEIGVVEAARR